MQRRLRCLAVGLALIDYCYRVATLPAGEGKYFASATESVLGGVAANAALAMLALGADTRMLSRLGDDASGDWVVSELQRRGIDTDFIERVPGRLSVSSAVCIDQRGERSIVNYRDLELFGLELNLPEGLLAGVDAVMCDTRWPSSVRAVLARIAELGIISVLDYDQNPNPESASLIELADYSIFAEPALLALSGCSDARAGIEWAAQNYPNTRVAVTCGGAGVLYWAENEVRSIATYPVPVVNTLGAGDVFHGACCYALACGRDFETALRWANAAAAMRVSGEVDFPSLEQVDGLYNQSTT